jgi:hypothetical protein
LERYVETAQPGDAVPPEVAALCMAGMKLARLSAMPTHLDSAIDLAAYAAICAELAEHID